MLRELAELCLAVLVIGWLAMSSVRAGPASAPSDPSLDWILSHPATAPSSQPATAPASPFADRQAAPRSGTITLSDGTKLTGQITSTAGKPLRVYDEQVKEYSDVPLDQVASMKAETIWERDEPEFQFKLIGSDEKVYSGKTYPARELRYTLKTRDGKTVSGSIAAPLYLKAGEERKTLVLHKRDKGEVGQTLKQLIYISEVRFDP